MLAKNIVKETNFKSCNINKPYIKMYCPEYNSLLLLIKNNSTIVFYKCCIGHAVNEELKTVTFDEIYNAPDPYNYILEINKIFAKNHDFNLPKKYPYYCNNTSSCNYVDKKIEKLELCVTGCNLNCIKCLLEKTINHDSNNMYWYLMNVIKGHNLRSIKPTCNGEPFLQKTKMVDYICSLTQRDCRSFNLVTNGTLLTKDDIIKIAKCTKYNKIKLDISVSCDSLDENTYKTIHKNATSEMFRNVINNIILLKQYNLLCNVNIVIQPENMNSVLDDLKYWKDNNIPFRVFPIRFFGDRALKIKDIVKQIQEKYPKNYYEA